MGFLFVKGSKTDSKPEYTGLQVQTSSSALPVAILFGTNSIAPNLFWYDNFQTITTKQKQGGKGGGSQSTTSYSYTADVMLGICEGPVTAILTAWLDKTQTTIAAEGLTLFNGAASQAPWPYLVSKYPTKALSYNGTAFVAESNYPLTDSAGIQNHNFETQGPLAGTCGVNTYDADGALCIQQFLTSTQFGTYFPSAYLDTSTLLGGTNGYSLQCYWKALGFGISPAISSVEAASSILERWLMLGNATAVWSDGILKFIPFAEDNLTGNGFTWTARTAPVYDLTDDDFIAQNDDPIKVSRIDVSQAYNVVTLEISDRSNRYSKLPIPVMDDCAVANFGPKPGTTVSAHELCDKAMASVSGGQMLTRLLYIRNNYKFGLSWEYSLLEPMDVVTITDSNLGYNKLAVRVIEIEEDDNGQLMFTCEDLVAGLSLPTSYPKQSITNAPINQGAAAVNVNTPMILEAPVSLTNGDSEIWVGASGVGGSANWGGCQIWASTDNATYSQIGQVNARANQGTLTAALADNAGTPDTTNTLAVDLSESIGQLLSSTATDAASGATLCLVDNEILTYTTAVLSGTNKYNLTSLYRGQAGTAHASHVIGAQFCRLDQNITKIVLPDSYVGKQLYIKFVSFNVFGNGIQDISTLTPYTFTPAGVAAGNDILTQLRTGVPTNLGTVTTGTAAAINLGSLPVGTLPLINLGTT